MVKGEPVGVKVLGGRGQTQNTIRPPSSSGVVPTLRPGRPLHHPTPPPTRVGEQGWGGDLKKLPHQALAGVRRCSSHQLAPGWPSGGPMAGMHHQGPAQHLLPPHAASTSTIRTCRAREIEHHAVDLAIANTSVTERLQSGFLIQENLTPLDGHGT